MKPFKRLSETIDTLLIGENVRIRIACYDLSISRERSDEILNMHWVKKNWPGVLEDPRYASATDTALDILLLKGTDEVSLKSAGFIRTIANNREYATQLLNDLKQVHEKAMQYGTLKALGKMIEMSPDY